MLFRADMFNCGRKATSECSVIVLKEYFTQNCRFCHHVYWHSCLSKPDFLNVYSLRMKSYSMSSSKRSKKHCFSAINCVLFGSYMILLNEKSVWNSMMMSKWWQILFLFGLNPYKAWETVNPNPLKVQSLMSIYESNQIYSITTDWQS